MYKLIIILSILFSSFYYHLVLPGNNEECIVTKITNVGYSIDCSYTNRYNLPIIPDEVAENLYALQLHGSGIANLSLDILDGFKKSLKVLSLGNIKFPCDCSISLFWKDYLGIEKHLPRELIGFHNLSSTLDVMGGLPSDFPPLSCYNKEDNMWKSFHDIDLSRCEERYVPKGAFLSPSLEATIIDWELREKRETRTLMDFKKDDLLQIQKSIFKQWNLIFGSLYLTTLIFILSYVSLLVIMVFCAPSCGQKEISDGEMVEFELNDTEAGREIYQFLESESFSTQEKQTENTVFNSTSGTNQLKLETEVTGTTLEACIESVSQGKVCNETLLQANACNKTISQENTSNETPIQANVLCNETPSQEKTSNETPIQANVLCNETPAQEKTGNETPIQANMLCIEPPTEANSWNEAPSQTKSYNRTVSQGEFNQILNKTTSKAKNSKSKKKAPLPTPNQVYKETFLKLDCQPITNDLENTCKRNNLHGLEEFHIKEKLTSPKKGFENQRIVKSLLANEGKFVFQQTLVKKINLISTEVDVKSKVALFGSRIYVHLEKQSLFNSKDKKSKLPKKTSPKKVIRSNNVFGADTTIKKVNDKETNHQKNDGSIVKHSVNNLFIGNPSVDDTSIDNPSGGGTSIVNPPVNNASIGNPSVAGTPIAYPSVGDTSIGDTSIVKTSVGDTSIGDTSIVKTSVGDTSIVNPSVDDTSIVKLSVSDTSTVNPTVDDTSIVNPSVGDASIVNPTVDDTSIGNPSVTDASIGNPSVGDASIGNPSVGDASIGNPSVGDSSIGNQSVANAPIVNSSVSDTSICDTSIVHPSAGDASVGNPSVDDTSIVNPSVGDTSIGNTSVGDTSICDTSIIAATDSLLSNGNCNDTNKSKDKDHPASKQVPKKKPIVVFKTHEAQTGVSKCTLVRDKRLSANTNVKSKVALYTLACESKFKNEATHYKQEKKGASAWCKTDNKQQTGDLLSTTQKESDVIEGITKNLKTTVNTTVKKANDGKTNRHKNDCSIDKHSVNKPIFGDKSVNEPSVDDTSIANSSVDDTSVGDTSIGNPSAGDASIANPSVDDTSVGDTSIGNPSGGGTSIANPPVDNASIGNQSVGDASIGNPSVRDSSIGNQSVADAPIVNSSVVDTSVVKPSVVDTSICDTSIVHPSAGDASVSNPSVDDTSIANPSVGDTSIVNPSVDDTSVVKPSVGDTSIVNPTFDDTSIVNPFVGDASIGNPSVGDLSIVNPSVGDTSNANPSVDDTSIVNPTVEDASIVNPSVGDTSNANPTFDDTSIVNPFIGDASIGNPSVGDASIANPSVDDTSICNASIVNPSVGDTSFVNPSVGDASIVNPSIDDSSIGNPSVGDASIGNPSVGDATIVNPSVVDTSIVNPSVGDASIVKSSIDHTSIGNPSVGDASISNSSVGDKSICDTSIIAATDSLLSNGNCNNTNKSKDKDHPASKQVPKKKPVVVFKTDKAQMGVSKCTLVSDKTHSANTNVKSKVALYTLACESKFKNEATHYKQEKKGASVWCKTDNKQQTGDLLSTTQKESDVLKGTTKNLKTTVNSCVPMNPVESKARTTYIKADNVDHDERHMGLVDDPMSTSQLDKIRQILTAPTTEICKQQQRDSETFSAKKKQLMGIELTLEQSEVGNEKEREHRIRPSAERETDIARENIDDNNCKKKTGNNHIDPSHASADNNAELNSNIVFKSNDAQEKMHTLVEDSKNCKSICDQLESDSEPNNEVVGKPIDVYHYYVGSDVESESDSDDEVVTAPLDIYRYYAGSDDEGEIDKKTEKEKDNISGDVSTNCLVKKDKSKENHDPNNLSCRMTSLESTEESIYDNDKFTKDKYVQSKSGFVDKPLCKVNAKPEFDYNTTDLPNDHGTTIGSDKWNNQERNSVFSITSKDEFIIQNCVIAGLDKDLFESRDNVSRNSNELHVMAKATPKKMFGDVQTIAVHTTNERNGVNNELKPNNSSSETHEKVFSRLTEDKPVNENGSSVPYSDNISGKSRAEDSTVSDELHFQTDNKISDKIDEIVDKDLRQRLSGEHFRSLKTKTPSQSKGFAQREYFVNQNLQFTGNGSFMKIRNNIERRSEEEKAKIIPVCVTGNKCELTAMTDTVNVKSRVALFSATRESNPKNEVAQHKPIKKKGETNWGANYDTFQPRMIGLKPTAANEKSRVTTGEIMTATEIIKMKNLNAIPHGKVKPFVDIKPVQKNSKTLRNLSDKSCNNSPTEKRSVLKKNNDRSVTVLSGTIHQPTNGMKNDDKKKVGEHSEEDDDEDEGEKKKPFIPIDVSKYCANSDDQPAVESDFKDESFIPIDVYKYYIGSDDEAETENENKTKNMEREVASSANPVNPSRYCTDDCEKKYGIGERCNFVNNEKRSLNSDNMKTCLKNKTLSIMMKSGMENGESDESNAGLTDKCPVGSIKNSKKILTLGSDSVGNTDKFTC